MDPDCPRSAVVHISAPRDRLHSADDLLRSGVDIRVSRLLGHEGVTTTHMYVEADLCMKERALGKLQLQQAKFGRYRPTGNLRFAASPCNLASRLVLAGLKGQRRPYLNSR